MKTISMALLLSGLAMACSNNTEENGTKSVSGLDTLRRKTLDTSAAVQLNRNLSTDSAGVKDSPH